MVSVGLNTPAAPTLNPGGPIPPETLEEPEPRQGRGLLGPTWTGYLTAHHGLGRADREGGGWEQAPWLSWQGGWGGPGCAMDQLRQLWLTRC